MQKFVSKRDKKIFATFSLPTFFGFDDLISSPKLLRWHFRGTAGTCHEMVSLQCQTRDLSPCQSAGVFNHQARCLVSGRVIRVRLLIMEGEVHMGKANQLITPNFMILPSLDVIDTVRSLYWCLRLFLFDRRWVSVLVFWPPKERNYRLTHEMMEVLVESRQVSPVYPSMNPYIMYNVWHIRMYR